MSGTRTRQARGLVVWPWHDKRGLVVSHRLTAGSWCLSVLVACVGGARQLNRGWTGLAVQRSGAQSYQKGWFLGGSWGDLGGILGGGREAGVPCMQRPKEDDSTAARRHGARGGRRFWTYVRRRDGQSKWRSLGGFSGAGTGSRRTIRNDTTWANKCVEACPGCRGLHVGNRSIRLRVSEQGS